MTTFGIALLLVASTSIGAAPGMAHAAKGKGSGTEARGADRATDADSVGNARPTKDASTGRNASTAKNAGTAKDTKHATRGKDAKRAKGDQRAGHPKRAGDSAAGAGGAGTGKASKEAKKTKRDKDSRSTTRSTTRSTAPRRSSGATAPTFGAVTGSPLSTASALNDLRVAENGIPVIQSIDIQRHAPAGGLTIAIIGLNFPQNEIGTVTINGQTTIASSDAPEAPEQIRAEIPPGSVGTVTDVVLSFSNGISIPNAASKIYYVTTPSVSSLSPTSGPVTGGGNITINGSGFIGAKEVRFGNTLAPSFTVNTANQITAVIPALAQGSHQVTVSHGQVGLGSGNIATLTSIAMPPMTTFSALPSGPVITSLTPANGLATGGTNVVIAGDRFTNASAVTFGGVNATSFAVDTDEQITAVSPAGTAGTASVVVTTPEGSSTPGESSTFTYTVPPAVTTHPTNQTVTLGATATFTAAANGTAPVTVQWQEYDGLSWNNVPGATSTTLQIANTTADHNGRQYRAVFNNATGVPATTNPASLTVNTPPAVTTHPTNQTVTLGATATFTAAATGTAPVTVQWEVSTDSGSTWNNVPGATSTTLQVAHTTAEQDGDQYKAIFNNVTGVPATTNAATLTVNVVPAITLHPVSQSVTAGAVVTFTAASTGTAPVTVQWEVSTDNGTSWTAVPGAVTTTLGLTTTAEQNGYRYRAVFTNITAQTATTDAATLTVNTVPVVLTHPANQTVAAGTVATFAVTASGTEPITVQWQVSTSGSWQNVPGATSLSLAVTTTLAHDGNQYRALLNNITGQQATSNAATLTVNDVPDAPPGVTAAANDSSIIVSWQPSPTHGAEVTGYTATASSGGATCSTPPSATTCVLGATAGVAVTVSVVAHSAIGNSAPGVSNQVTPPAPVPPAAPPETTLTLTTDEGLISTADPGEEIVFIGTGFAPFSTVVMTLYSEPIVLGTVVTDAQGSFRKPVTVPATLRGSHTMVAQGVAPDGSPRAMKLAITVTTGGRRSGLAVTGSAVSTIALIGLALTVTGALLLLGGARRRQAG